MSKQNPPPSNAPPPCVTPPLSPPPSSSTPLPSSTPPPWHCKLRSISRLPVPPKPNPTLIVVNEWVWPSHCHQYKGLLRHGQLLRWMDITACLSAERHAQVPCVTVSVDTITFHSSVSVGQVVVLRAVVNRAFRTSLEVGLVVESEDPYSGLVTHICKAFFVFVARPTDGSKAQLPPVTPVTEEEKREYLLATERRRMRTTYAKDLERLVKSLDKDKDKDKRRKSSASSSSSSSSSSLSSSATVVHTVNIVLPVHANHHGTTFGGQIMEWVTDVATLSGLRLSRSPLVLEGIESVHFRGPSKVGERVFLQASVNKIFTAKRFEVGVRVEGYAVEGERRHINSAFFTFRLADESATLPHLTPGNKEQEARAANAVARHCLWLDRIAIQFEEKQVILSRENAYELIVRNVSQLMTNFSRTLWDPISTDPVTIMKHQTDQTLVVRVSDTLPGVTTEQCFNKLVKYSERIKWDFMCKHCRSFRSITPDDNLLHLSMKNPQSDKSPLDFVLLGSQRKQEYDGRHLYTLAFQSVLCDDMPPLGTYSRSHVISSGYILRDSTSSGSGDQSCDITYLHQVGSSVLPFIAKDLLGVSSLLSQLYSSLRRHIYTDMN